MSKAKELRTSPENNLNLYEWFSLFVPEKKSKYVDVFLRTLKKTKNLDSFANEIAEKYSVEYKISKEDLKNFPKFHLIFLHRLIDSFFDGEDLKTFQKFCEYNERGLIKQNDLSTYNDFEEIKNAVSVTETIVLNKEMEKQIVVVHEDDIWLLLRPLTFAASKKYGSNTKWCTTQNNNPEYFKKYSTKGVLIYCINKSSGYKVASFFSLQKDEPEFSFWNQKDQRIDSLETELPDELRLLINKISTDKKAKTNRFLLPENELKKEEIHELKYNSGSIPLGEPVPIEDVMQPEINERHTIRVNREEEVQEQIMSETEQADIPTVQYGNFDGENVMSSETE